MSELDRIDPMTLCSLQHRVVGQRQQRWNTIFDSRTWGWRRQLWRPRVRHSFRKRGIRCCWLEKVLSQSAPVNAHRHSMHINTNGVVREIQNVLCKYIAKGATQKQGNWHNEHRHIVSAFDFGFVGITECVNGSARCQVDCLLMASLTVVTLRCAAKCTAHCGSSDVQRESVPSPTISTTCSACINSSAMCHVGAIASISSFLWWSS